MPAPAPLRPSTPSDGRVLPALGGHIPALDGLRGIAVLAVCCYHFWLNGGLRTLTPGFAWTAGLGWTGVDLFFVLSGFLITGILIDSRTLPGYYRTFFARRVLRIFPLYYAYAAAYLMLMPLAHLVISGGAFAPDGTPLVRASVWAYGYNIAAGLGVAGAALPNLGHLWSLAVEEQFYLVWPSVVQRTSPRRLARICVTLMIFAPAARVAFRLAGYPYAAFTMTPCRIDALAAGALTAILLRREDGRRMLERWWPFAAAGSVATLAVILTGGNVQPFGAWMNIAGYSALAVLFAVVTGRAATLDGTERVHAVLTNSSLMKAGRYSYALYLVHHPIAYKLVVWGVGGPLWLRLTGSPALAQAINTIVGITVSFAVARVCWTVIEQPFLRMKHYFEYEAAVDEPRAPVAVPA